MMNKTSYERLIAHIKRKKWWHVPPVDPDGYQKRGKFLASSFSEAEFYGRPLDEPQKVSVSKPLVGDEAQIARELRILPQHDGMSLEEIAAHDAKWRDAALKRGYDSILLMSPKCYVEWAAIGKIPRSLELNILRVSDGGPHSRKTSLSTSGEEKTKMLHSARS